MSAHKTQAEKDADEREAAKTAKADAKADAAEAKAEAKSEKREAKCADYGSCCVTQAALEVFDSEFIRANGGNYAKAASEAFNAGEAFEAERVKRAASK